MGFFSDIWNFLKTAADIISKIFYTTYRGVKYVVECLRDIDKEIKNSWVGTILDALPYIIDLLDFLKSKGANLNVNGYKSKLKDMDLDSYGDHHFDLKIREN